MTKPKPASERKPLMLGNVNVRMPRGFMDWLHDQAVEDGRSISDIVRDAVALAIVRSGEAERYGIEQVVATPDEDADAA